MAKSRKDLSHRGDVSWQSHGLDVEGTVMRKVDERTEAADRTVGASKAEPHYKLQKDRTGQQADLRQEPISRTDRGAS
ncbi:DUF2945 domain-containing protein [Streptomyces anulatus]|uniref:DUF2945 domain-containing protein n=1 Tax=Streptomyces anulatus TaxID=1892 RepID=UPI00363825C1